MEGHDAMNGIRLARVVSDAGRWVTAVALAAVLVLALTGRAHAVTSSVTLTDAPVFATNTVPGNMAFTLSVEFPTAVSVANLGDYSDMTNYPGYFDPVKCYTYVFNNGGVPTSSTYSYAIAEASYFKPAAFGTGTYGHTCSGTANSWSGNFMNWATMQTIDPFRWALTGGYRSTDNSSGYPLTVLEKAWGASQGSAGNFPYRGVDQPTGSNISLATIHQVTPLTNWPDFNSGIWGNGNAMVISGVTTDGGYYHNYGGFEASAFQNNVYEVPSNVNSSTATPGYTGPGSSVSGYTTMNTNGNAATYRMYIRVSVCDTTSSLGVMGLESNCVGYGTPNGSGVYPVYKPQGLIQQYSNQIKYSVFSYLNTSNTSVQGAVLRAPMEFVGPTYPTPLSTVVNTNPAAEWYSTTGVLKSNPDSAAASGTSGATVTMSGVINYINNFGEYGAMNYIAGDGNYVGNTQIYMTYDHVSELYYAAIRYFENLGNVPQWLAQTVTYNSPTSVVPYVAWGQIGQSEPTYVQIDGFPAVTTWTDPIAYRCQKNFIVGIGDDHTWTDYNVGGSTQFGQDVDNHYPAPSAITGDTLNQANTWLNELEVLEGLPQQPWWASASSGYNPGSSIGAGDGGSTFYMAGLAYGAHVLDIRPDLTDTQTVSTYWMDVEEGQHAENENPFYLAAKYGGFKIPSNYSITNTTPLPLSEYDTSGQTINMNGTTHPLPDNYFQAGNATQMVTSLTSAFSNISIGASASTTTFSVSNPNAVTSGSYSFSAAYNPSGWTGTVTAYTVSFATGSNTPLITQAWTSDSTLQTQLAGTGWSTNRKVVTWGNGSGCGSTFSGQPFEPGNLCPSTQLNYLANPTYSTSTTSTQYLDYRRGDTTNQVGSTATGSTQSLRARSLFLGDIVDAALTPVSGPSMSYSESTNPGYAAFKANYANRPTMVYAAANDGMVHGFLGSSGSEVFAYVPNALFQGPTATPQTNGLAQLGNPNYSHHFYVDATPITADLDLGRTGGTTGTPNWATVLIGGLGKGGTTFYAINVTDSNGLQSASEAQIAQDVLWEFTDSTMGYSYGTPVVAKTAQYGWVVLLTSGYDNSDGYGYLYIVNPATGALLQKIKTPTTSSGLTQVSAFTEDYTNYTAESAYVGDLNGQVWRFDLRATSGTYPTPVQIAQLTDSQGNAQPVTSAPDIEVHPTTRERYVLIGTGKLLTSTDIGTTSTQTFYALIDGTAGGFNSALTTPITRTNLTQIASITAGATIPTTSKGWYYDLPAGYRVITMPVSYAGDVAFAALLPAASDPCNPTGSTEVYATNYSTGQSVINSTSTGSGSGSSGSSSVVAYQSFSNQVTTLEFLNTNGNGVQLTAGDSKNNVSTISTVSYSVATRALNWREIPTPD